LVFSKHFQRKALAVLRISGVAIMPNQKVRFPNFFVTRACLSDSFPERHRAGTPPEGSESVQAVREPIVSKQGGGAFISADSETGYRT